LSVAPKHGKAAGEVVEKEDDVAEVAVAATQEGVQGKSRCALVTVNACEFLIPVLLTHDVCSLCFLGTFC
jgi:hypothetical protein